MQEQFLQFQKEKYSLVKGIPESPVPIQQMWPLQSQWTVTATYFSILLHTQLGSSA